MALDISTLQSPFIDQLSFGLAKSAVLGLETLKYVDVRTDVNGSLQLNTIDSTINFTNTTCSTTDTGSTVFAGNTLETCFVASNQDICIEDLQRVWYGKYLSKSVMGATDLGTFQDFIMSEKADKIGQELEKLIWIGVKDASPFSGLTAAGVQGGSGNGAMCDGFIQKAYMLSATTPSAQELIRTAFTVSNAIVNVDNIYGAAPDRIKGREDLRLFLSPSDFDKYLSGLRNANYFHFASSDKNISEILHPGARNLKVTKVNGMTNVLSGTFILTYSENMVFGTLAEKDFMAIDGIFDPYNRKYKVSPRFRVGVQFVFGQDLVRNL